MTIARGVAIKTASVASEIPVLRHDRSSGQNLKNNKAEIPLQRSE